MASHFIPPKGFTTIRALRSTIEKCFENSIPFEDFVVYRVNDMFYAVTTHMMTTHIVVSKTYIRYHFRDIDGRPLYSCKRLSKFEPFSVKWEGACSGYRKLDGEIVEEFIKSWHCKDTEIYEELPGEHIGSNDIWSHNTKVILCQLFYTKTRCNFAATFDKNDLAPDPSYSIKVDFPPVNPLCCASKEETPMDILPTEDNLPFEVFFDDKDSEPKNNVKPNDVVSIAQSKNQEIYEEIKTPVCETIKPQKAVPMQVNSAVKKERKREKAPATSDIMEKQMFFSPSAFIQRPSPAEVDPEESKKNKVSFEDEFKYYEEAIKLASVLGLEDPKKEFGRTENCALSLFVALYSKTRFEEEKFGSQNVTDAELLKHMVNILSEGVASVIRRINDYTPGNLLSKAFINEHDRVQRNSVSTLSRLILYYLYKVSTKQESDSAFLAVHFRR